MADEEVQAAAEELGEMAVEDEELTLDLGKKKKKKSKKVVSGCGAPRRRGWRGHGGAGARQLALRCTSARTPSLRSLPMGPI